MIRTTGPSAVKIRLMSAHFPPHITRVTSTVSPHIPLRHTHLPIPAHHTDEQLAVWIQEVHDTSREQFISLTSAIPHNAGISTLCVHLQSDPNNHPRRHTSITNQQPGSYVPSPNTDHTWLDGPEAYPIHRNAHRYATIYCQMRAQRSGNIDSSALADHHAIRMRMFDADDA